MPDMQQQKYVTLKMKRKVKNKECNGIQVMLLFLLMRFNTFTLKNTFIWCTALLPITALTPQLFPRSCSGAGIRKLRSHQHSSRCEAKELSWPSPDK